MNGNGNRQVEHLLVSLSDIHIGELEFREDGTRNLVTDFTSDQELINLLSKLRIRGRTAKKKFLVLNGDIFDSQTVAMLGGYEDPPIESVGVYKMRRIIRMHQEIFDCFKELIDDDWMIIYIIGNHDVFTSWPKVQREIRRRIARRRGERLIFADQFEVAGFHFRHGYEIEMHTAVPSPEERFTDGYQIKGTRVWLPETIFGKMRKKRKYRDSAFLPRRILNAPLGNALTVIWVVPLKRAGKPTDLEGPHRWIGRMYTSGPIWRYAILRPIYWGFALRFALLWLRGLIYILLGEAAFNIRRKSSIRQFLNAPLKVTLRQLLRITFVWTRQDTGADQVTFGYEILKKRQEETDKPPLRAVVMGHTHKAGRWTNQNGTIFNTGTWVDMFKVPDRAKGWGRVKPEPDRRLTFFMAEQYTDGETSANIFEYEVKNFDYKEVI